MSKKYKIINDNSFTQNYYIYISNYEKGRILGTMLATLIIVASLIIGFITKNVVFDTVVTCISFGSYLTGITLLKIFYKEKKTGYFGNLNEIRYDFYSIKNFTGPVLILSRYFELYFPFLLTFLIQNTVLKIVIPLIFIILNIKIKLSYNFIENKKKAIIKKSLYPSLFFLGLGLIFNYQKIFNVTIFDNFILLFFATLMGIYKSLLNRRLKSLKDTYYNAKEKKKNESDIKNLSTLFEFKIKKTKIKNNSDYTPKYIPKEITNEEKEKYKYAKYLKERQRLNEIKNSWMEEHIKQEKLKEEKYEKERLENLEKQIAQGKIKNVSQEDEAKLRAKESEKYKVNINDSVKMNRASVRR